MRDDKRVALVIGNGKYQKTSWLPNPPNDAEKMSAVLNRLGFDVLDGTNLDYATFAGRVRDFGRALRDAHVALFFYAGHGLQVRGENYVVPVDAALEHEADVQLELITVQTILASMEIGNRTSIVILDACRDNPLARNLARAIRSTRPAADEIGRGLGRLESGIGTYIAFATSPNNVALDGAGAANSPFTTALLKHIETPGVAINDLMMRVRNDVIEATDTMRGGPQVPWDNSSLVAPFYFSPSTTAQKQKAPPPDPSILFDPAERDWERWRIATTEELAIIEAYITKYAASEPIWSARARQRLEVVQALLAERKRQREAERQEAEYKAKGFVPVEVWTPKGQERRWIEPGSDESFKDFEHGPELVVVPKGEFLMGSTEEEIAALKKDYSSWDWDREGPQHSVTIPAPFAIGRYAVTRGEFAAFVNDTGYSTKGGAYVWTGSEWNLDPSKSWRDPGFNQDDSHPVVCVNWEDAHAYVAWLNRLFQTALYRLPSEAEWEYTARAGTATPFWWGTSISTQQANYDGNYTFGGGKKGEWRQKTVPAKSFDANPWGLYQVHGNVLEWCEDQWHDSYKSKPDRLKKDGGAWTTGGSSARVLRGGSWFDDPSGLRSASRFWITPVNRSYFIGFRIARTLTS